MTYLWFSGEHVYGPNGHRASVPIRIHPPTRQPFTINGVLDTGAEVSCFDRALLPILGIGDVSIGEQIPVYTANNEWSLAYIHPVQIEFLGHKLTIDVAFCPDWPDGTANLLGMRGFFEQVMTAFEHRVRKVYVRI